MDLLVVEENLSYSIPVVRLYSKCVIVLYPCDRRHGMTFGGAVKGCVETSVNSLVLRILNNLWCQGSLHRQFQMTMDIFFEERKQNLRGRQ